MRFCLQSFKQSLIQPRQSCSANVRYATNLSRFTNGGPAVIRTLDMNAGDANFVLRDCFCNVLTAGERDYVGRGGRKAEGTIVRKDTVSPAKICLLWIFWGKSHCFPPPAIAIYTSPRPKDLLSPPSPSPTRLPHRKTLKDVPSIPCRRHPTASKVEKQPLTLRGCQ